jgi:hypothetical protein
VSTLTRAEQVVMHLMTEQQLLSNVLELCSVLGLLAYHTYDSRRSQSGFPDLVIVGRHNILFVELKRQGGRLSREQRQWGEAIGATAVWGRHDYHVWRPHEWQTGEIEETLRSMT